MSTPQSSLFRQEALAARSDSTAGPPIQIRPVGAGWLTLFFALLCAAVLLLLVLGSYTRKERVQGVVQARGGVAALVVPDAAVVRESALKPPPVSVNRLSGMPVSVTGSTKIRPASNFVGRVQGSSGVSAAAAEAAPTRRAC